MLLSLHYCTIGVSSFTIANIVYLKELIIRARNFAFIVDLHSVYLSHCLSFSDKNFQYKTVINSALCVCFRTDWFCVASQTAAHRNFDITIKNNSMTWRSNCLMHLTAAINFLLNNWVNRQLDIRQLSNQQLN